MKLGKKIRRARLRLGLSQSEFGEAIGWDKSQVSRLENGKSSPTLASLRRIAIALGEKIEELLR